MKNYIKSAFLLLVGIVAMSACSSSDDHEYEWATVSGQQVYFSKDLADTYEVSTDASSFSIELSRISTEGAVDVPLQVTASEGSIFTVPASTSFADGSNKASITITYDPAQIEFGKFDTLTIAIADAQLTTPYGASEYQFLAGMPLSYTSLGKAIFVDNWFEFEGEVAIEQCDQRPNVYRIAKPYLNYSGDDYFIMDKDQMDDYLELTLLSKGQTLGGVEVTEDNLVYFPTYTTGAIHPSYTDDVIRLLYPTSYSSMKDDPSFWVHNYVKEYDEDGNPAVIQLAPAYYMLNYGGWNQTQADDIITIYFPGHAPKDYDAELSYSGVLTNVAGEVFALAEVALGDDVTSAKAVVVKASEDAEEVALQVAAGELEATDVTSGTVYVPIADGLTGKLQLVVVALANGDEGVEVVNVIASEFEYYGGGENPWKAIGTGLLTENLLTTAYGLDPITYEVEIEEYDGEPGLYRIVNAFEKSGEAIGEAYASYGYTIAYTPTNFEVNATDPDGVYLPMQSTGVDDGDGIMYIGSLGGYFLSAYSFETVKGAGYLGTLKDGVITLPVIPDEDDNGEAYTLQGVAVQAGSKYDAGLDSEFKLVLPEAVTSQARTAAKKAVPAVVKSTPWKKAALRKSIKNSRLGKQLHYVTKFERNALR